MSRVEIQGELKDGVRVSIRQGKSPKLFSVHVEGKEVCTVHLDDGEATAVLFETGPRPSGDSRYVQWVSCKPALEHAGQSTVVPAEREHCKYLQVVFG